MFTTIDYLWMAFVGAPKMFVVGVQLMWRGIVTGHWR